MNNAGKYIYHKFFPGRKRWYPFISVYYLNYSCEFRCSYCCDGSGTPYYLMPEVNVTADEALKIIRRIRRYTDYFVLTGGEPLQYPFISELLPRIAELKFRNVILTTNGYYYDKFMIEISGSVNSLVFSLDSMESKKSEELWGMPAGTFDRVMENIIKARDYYAEIKAARTSIILSSVITPGNIDDLFEVYDFANKNGFEFAACPQLMGVRANGELYGNKDYTRFYDHLIKEKKKGRKIYGSVKYLEYMRDLRQFDCKPFTMLVVSPGGTIFYPCLEMGHPAGNIMDFDSLHTARALGEAAFGPRPKCSDQCHSACALTFALMI